MQDFLALDPRVRHYLVTWYTLGVAALAVTVMYHPFVLWPDLLCYFGASLLLSVKTVRGSSKSSSGSTSITLASAASFAAMMGIGPAGGVLVEFFSTAVDSVFPRRRPLYQAAFNLACVSVGSLAAGVVYDRLGGPRLLVGQPAPVMDIAKATGPMLVASLVYFFVNTMAVAQVVALVSETKLSDIWRRNFRTSFIGYTAGAACSVLIVGLSSHLPVGYVALLAVPILYACHSQEQSDEARLDALEKGKERLEKLYVASIRTLALTVAAKDRYTSGHIHRVTAYSLAIARHMRLSQDELTDLETGALLHDVGKIGVPEYILTKPGRLTDDEMSAMRRHAEIGWAILQPLDFPDIVKKIVRHHHEWMNGSGYPDGVTGDDMPLLVRIVCVSDVFDALTSDRPYRSALSLDQARDIMGRNEGTQFDPVILRTFFEVLDTTPWQELSAVPSDSPVLTEILDKLATTIEPSQPAPLPSTAGNQVAVAA